jgi:hypothetical protein
MCAACSKFGERCVQVLLSIVNVKTKIRILKYAGNFLISWQPVSFSRRNLLHGDSYFEECDLSADAPASESGTLCVVRVDKSCLKENRYEKSSKYCRIYLWSTHLHKSTEKMSSYIPFIQQIITLRQSNT